MRSTEVLRDLACQLQALLRITAGKQHLSSTQAQILLILPVDGLPLSVLAQRLGLDPSTISRIVDKMVHKGWIRRETTPEDGRISRIIFTHQGYELYLQLTDSMDAEIQNILSEISAEQLEKLNQDLEDLAWRLLKHRESKPS
jgi:DNA-binding MarR family transcriptional regulator